MTAQKESDGQFKYYTQRDAEKCCTGCNIFFGGEIRHIKECVFYPESLTEIYDKKDALVKSLQSKIEIYESEIQLLRDLIVEAREVIGYLSPFKTGKSYDFLEKTKDMVKR